MSNETKICVMCNHSNTLPYPYCKCSCHEICENKINSIAWHEGNLENQRIHLNNKIKRLDDLKEEIRRIKSNVQVHDIQIHQAKIDGLNTFDSSKYLIKRKKRLTKGDLE